MGTLCSALTGSSALGSKRNRSAQRFLSAGHTRIVHWELGAETFLLAQGPKGSRGEEAVRGMEGLNAEVMDLQVEFNSHEASGKLLA